MGPVFYSMNIGKVHYIMLDNTVYKNDGEPGHSTIAGSRNYDKYFSQDNIAFLKRGLEACRQVYPDIRRLPLPDTHYGLQRR